MIKIGRLQMTLLLTIAVAVGLISLLSGQAFAGKPSNNDFSSATVISSVPHDPAALSTVGSTTETGEPVTCFSIGSTVWYEYTPSVDQFLIADTNGSDFNTVLTAQNGNAVDSLVEVGCDDNGGTDGIDSKISFLGRAGVTYYIQAGGSGGGTGQLEFNLTTTGVKTGLPTVLNFQGRLGLISGAPVTGTKVIAFRIYDAATLGTKLWEETQSVEVTNGLFNVLLGSINVNLPTALFGGNTRFIEVQVEGASAQSPRTRIGTVPFAMLAAIAQDVVDGSVTTADLAANAVDSSKIVNGTVAAADLAANSVDSSKIVNGTVAAADLAANSVDNSTIADGSVTTADLAANSVTAANVEFNYAGSVGEGGIANDSNLLDGLDSLAFWKLAGNSGTTAGTNFVGTTDDEPLELHVFGTRALRLEPNVNSPNVIGGYSGNSVTSAYGATIGGGGTSFNINSVSGIYGTVGGGSNNTVSQQYSTVGGGLANTAGSPWSTIGGGSANTITATNTYATIGGGQGNTASAHSSTVGGGANNRVTDAGGTVSGGINNQAGDNLGTSIDRLYATVGGGTGNTASGVESVVGGGTGNTANGSQSTIGGGTGNTTTGVESTVGGGFGNTAGGAAHTTVGGGFFNNATDTFSTVGGGQGNSATGTRSTVSGGQSNTADGGWSTVGGGENNTASGDRATVGGGRSNAGDGAYGTIAGGGEAAPGTAATANRVTDDYGTVGGGGNNQAGDGTASTTNERYATVGGGQSNTASGQGSMIPGGFDNEASGDFSFAAGRSAQATWDGSFVWADGGASATVSPAVNSFTVQAGGGIWMGNNNSPTIGAGRLINTSSGGFLTVGGIWTDSSDANLKTNFEAVNTDEILSLVADLPVTSWNFMTEGDEVRHLGPTAQDFYEAFSLGQNDTSIASLDTGGVALAAIQALYDRVQEQEAQIAALKGEGVAPAEATSADLAATGSDGPSGLFYGLLLALALVLALPATAVAIVLGRKALARAGS